MKLQNKVNRIGFRLAFIFLIGIFLVSFVSASSFELSERSLKFKVSPGESQEVSLNINSLEAGGFKLIVNPVWASVSEASFSLKEGEQKAVLIKSNSAGLSEGVYVSSLSINNGVDVEIIPLVLEVQSQDMFFGGSLDIPLKYQSITSKDMLLAQLRIYDLISPNSDVKLGPSDVEITYSIYSIDGTVILRDSEKVKVDNMIQLSKVISFKKDVALGTYVLAASVKYGTGISTSTSLFEIKKKSFFNILSLNIPSNVLFLGLVIICLVILGYIGYEIKRWIYLSRESNRVEVQKKANKIFR